MTAGGRIAGAGAESTGLRAEIPADRDDSFGPFQTFNRSFSDAIMARAMKA